MSDLGATGLRPDVAFFNESQSRIVISVKADHEAEVLTILEDQGSTARAVGYVQDAQYAEKSRRMAFIGNGRWPTSIRHGPTTIGHLMEA